MLASPRPDEPLLLYVAATTRVVSSVLVVEREESGHAQKIQRPVYFISEVLSESKARYPQIQKIAYGVFMTSRKLLHYFQAHPITVVSSFPLSEVINNRDATGRIAKWAMELMAFDISYTPRTAIKSQALADFVAEWTEVQEPPSAVDREHWTLFFDGSLMLSGAGAGVVLTSPKGERIKYVLQIHFAASNNVAEYEALLHGLRLASSLGVRRLLARGDSELVVRQVMKDWSCRDPTMEAYCQEVRKLESKFDGLEITHVLRRDNEAADELAKMGSARAPVPEGIFLSKLHAPSVRTEPAPAIDDHPRVASDEQPAGGEVLTVTPDWTLPFLDYLLRDILPSDQTEARRLARRAKAFVVVEDELYKKSTSGILQRCIPEEQGQQLLSEIHSGSCGHHAAPRTLVGKAFRQGFYWPTAVADAERIVRTCEGCQFFARQTHLPAQALQTIPITWPFAVWGLDMVGPLKAAPGGYTHLFVAVDKFTKWIEAKPVATITAAKAADFFRDIVHRFGVPNSIITDNGTQFTGAAFRNFCDSYGIRLDFASVAHPRSNGQVERSNGLIMQGIKPRIFERLKRFAGKWAAELPSVLWSLRTSPNRSTGFTPFFMVFGAEAVLPTDIDHGAPRVRAYQEDQSERSRQDDLDQLDEVREVALLRSRKYQQNLRRYHSRQVRSRAFEVGDLVLRRVQTNVNRHKLSPPWEGPYVVHEVIRPGAYRLKDEEGNVISNAWNIEQLCRFYA